MRSTVLDPVASAFSLSSVRLVGMFWKRSWTYGNRLDVWVRHSFILVRSQTLRSIIRTYFMLLWKKWRHSERFHCYCHCFFSTIKLSYWSNLLTEEYHGRVFVKIENRIPPRKYNLINCVCCFWHRSCGSSTLCTKASSFVSIRGWLRLTSSSSKLLSMNKQKHAKQQQPALHQKTRTYERYEFPPQNCMYYYPALVSPSSSTSPQWILRKGLEQDPSYRALRDCSALFPFTHFRTR